MSFVKLQAENGCKTSFYIKDNPHNESDLLGQKLYIDFYRQVGLGCPVTVSVYREQPRFWAKALYSYSFRVHGNSISLDTLTQITDLFKDCSTLENMRVVADKGYTQFLYSFTNYQQSYEMYQKLKDIANVGTYHMQDPDSGLYLIRIDFYATD